MAYMQCIECGRLSKESRCREHRTRQARGYDRHHDRIRQDRIQRNPVCEDCGHVAIHMNHSCNRQEACDRCPLELHHVTPLAQHRYQMPEDRDYLILCRKCHRERTRLGEFD